MANAEYLGEAGQRDFNQTEIIYEVELMFSDLLNHSGPEKYLSEEGSSKNFREIVDFKSVSFQKFMLRNVCDGIHEYIPITFDDSHFS